MSNFPTTLDDDISVPPVSDNITETGEESIQATRSAIFAIEENIGTGAQGAMESIAARIAVSINPDGTVKSESLEGIGLINLPITNGQISATAAISESKLNLTFTTQLLHDLFANLDNRTDILEGFVSTVGVRIIPHDTGTDFRHELSHIDVDSGNLSRVNIHSGTTVLRDLTNAYTFASELANDALNHTRADNLSNITTPPANQAHNASGIYIDPGSFTSVPETANDLQKFADYVDSSSLVLLGSRTQNLFGNGVPNTSRSNSLINVKAGEALVDPVEATTYLLYGSAISPVDDLDHGDDVILLNPGSDVLADNTFDAQFSQVKAGDYITVNYGNGSVPVKFTVDSAKKFLNGTSRLYSIRINGKNLFASDTAIVRIDRPFFHEARFNTLALAAANNPFNEIPSLVISNPAGAAALGNGFDPSQFDSTHFNLYLALYPSGNPLQKTIIMPPVDVTGDAGISTGSYTLHAVVENINAAFRTPGFNERFIAFAYKGQLGVALADRYNDVSFSILSGTVDGYGSYTAISDDGYLNNVVDNYLVVDPLGFGLSGADIASPVFITSYSTPASALTSPTTIFSPRRKNYYYVDGVERDTFSEEIFTTKDGYGDGYWLASLATRQVLGSRVETTYVINLDLTTSGLKKGKTLVVQPAISFDSASYNSADYGRFLIKDVVFDNCPGPDTVTTITVYDAIHGVGTSPFASSLNIPVRIHFTDDSVSFNMSHVSDTSPHSSVKRFFEAYVDSNGDSFTHERARLSATGANIVVDTVNLFTLYGTANMSSFDLLDVSPKLRGFSFGKYKKITLFINSYDGASGIFNGYLCKYDFPSTYSQQGPTVTGKKGEVTRFYDNTTVDYIDVIVPLNLTVDSFISGSLDIQLYNSLQLNQEKIFLGTCQFNQESNQVEYLRDKRQFGNTTERNLSTSAIDFISAPQRLLDENGVVKGFDLASPNTLHNDVKNQITLRGGTALINGKLLDFNDLTVSVPFVQEMDPPLFISTLTASGTYTNRWYLCANSNGELEFIFSTDFNAGDTSYTGLDHLRLVKVINSPFNTVPYAIRSTYFSQLLKIRDLVPLFVVTASADEGATDVSVLDARRFIAGGHRGSQNAYTLGANASFHSLEALHTYLGELTMYQSYLNTQVNNIGQTIWVRDNFELSALDFPNFKRETRYMGDGGKFTITNTDSALRYGRSYTTLLGNSTFTNLPFDIDTRVGLRIKGDSIKFENCHFTYLYDVTGDNQFIDGYVANLGHAGAIYAECPDNTSPTGSLLTNVNINNCTFTLPVDKHFPCIQFVLNNIDSYVERLNISHNRFDHVQDALASLVDDKQPVIAFTCALHGVSTSTTIGPRFVNCHINNNICNKNQLIMLTSEVLAGSLSILDMPVTIGFSVDNNICGAICYLSRQDISSDVLTNAPITINDINRTPTNLLNKEEMLYIRDNICRFIFCGNQYGHIACNSTNRIYQDLGSLGSLIEGFDLYSGSVIISGNVCSWIHVGKKNPLSSNDRTGSLVIENNNLTAANTSFLSSYYDLLTDPTPPNVGILVDSYEGT